MEKDWKKKKGIMKRKRGRILSSCNSMTKLNQDEIETRALFPLMLAASFSNNFRRSPGSELLLKQCLNQLHVSLLSNAHHAIVPALSLLPFLLNSNCTDIATKSAEVVGAAALVSFDMNERIALDDDLLNGLIMTVVSSKKKKSVSLAACIAVLDLSTTSIGRRRFLEFSALENFISCFNQAPKTSETVVFLSTGKVCGKICLRIGFEEDEFVVSLLNLVITLTNACTIEKLEKIPKKLSATLLVYLKRLWCEVHKQMLLGTMAGCNHDRHLYASNIQTSYMAESIFRLSLNADHSKTPPIENVKRSIFYLAAVSFENFVLNSWEASPLLMRRLNAFSKQDDVFYSFVQFLKSYEAVPALISSILQNFVSCSPIASDELNILNYLNEVRNHLGCPIIYEQDIRVLKTQYIGERHFFNLESCFQDPHYLYANDILRCEQAYKEGHTTALRGMEFRYENISAIVDGLASLFGQPSAGANMYLTPPCSQGLARHCDDHCVLVCQLIGAKQWTVFPKSSLPLPRLYQPVTSVQDKAVGISDVADCLQFLLTEGDILYIPRGLYHEACTVGDSDPSSEAAGFSLHLTLAIEVEPPFEWEGFIHLALFDWAKNQDLFSSAICDSISNDLKAVSVNLMHIGIKLMGDLDPTFRKACLVGAISVMPVTESWLHGNQRLIFKELINKIHKSVYIDDLLNRVKDAVALNEDLFERIRWLQRLFDERASIEANNWNYSLMQTQKLVSLFDRVKDKAESAFIELKSKFCCEVVFEGVEQRYMLLLNKYKKARKNYSEGMLSLHCT